MSENHEQDYLLSKSKSHFARALITGGAGFVGSHLAQRLIDYGVQVTILDNFSSGFEDNVPKQSTLIRGDVRDNKAVQSAAQGAEIIFHLAEYIPNYPGHVIRYSASNPREDLDVCVGGTINVLEEARKNRAHFVLASTAAVYGSKSIPVIEDMQPEPISPYGTAKYCAELYTQLYHRVYGVPITIFRFFNLFGPGQRKYVMYDFLLKAKRDPEHIDLLGTGQEVRDYMYVGDAIDYVISLVQVPEDNSLPIFNLGTGQGRTTLEVIQVMTQVLGINPKLNFQGNPWTGNINSLLADMTKTRRYINGDDANFEDCLHKLIDWFRTASPV